MLHQPALVDAVRLRLAPLLRHGLGVQHLARPRIVLDAPRADAGLNLLRAHLAHAFQQSRLQPLHGGLARALLARQPIDFRLVTVGVGLQVLHDARVCLGLAGDVRFQRFQRLQRRLTRFVILGRLVGVHRHSPRARQLVQLHYFVSSLLSNSRATAVPARIIKYTA